MSESELSEIDLLNAEIAQLKQVLTGVKTAKSTPDDARSKIAQFCQSKGGQDMFMKADPGMEENNIYHNPVKGGNPVERGGGGGGCCVAS
mmetsp:Transcript_4408/g.9528  ORF Transcript_4408/g.9528 Transcript_4408/m.9528 type:complete len:90 (+) Transcript_4408:200-469(+)|eukprot:CAMPEP_0172546558 /NCGR_PEP_ID=MMETSP1067-20121228/16302_1 /TAXON_ID=265564 ORGANISM="Thalassiosira punctigera, Strain Tpunct2005C2" /NCGR_SAMPLE_ID=MMETSP1067 /ASSEMBLY_ACC=CAM_ASM_000444 /LENGTH=89 /DNA_ID=CAMNT_0013333513 /DNA_START=168 /DNA_END=437 /DNA_ORIENTATION=-